MSEELQRLEELNSRIHRELASSSLSREDKLRAYEQAFEMSLKAATAQTANAAGGDFLRILMLILTQILPIILELLNPDN